MTLLPIDEPALGRYVAERLGLTWTCHDDPYSLGLDALAGLAVRRNPKRAHLVVSTVLAKHVPGSAFGRYAVLGCCWRLGSPTCWRLPIPRSTVSSAAPGASSALRRPRPVWDTWSRTGSPAPTTCTRRGARTRTATTAAGFDEEHSHAVGHHLQPPLRAARRRPAAGAGRRRADHRDDGAELHRRAARAAPAVALCPRDPARPASGSRRALLSPRAPPSSASPSTWCR